MKLIKDCLVWEEMGGSSSLEKKINSYLCFALVCREDVPADECLTHAKRLAMLPKSIDKKPIFDILWENFGSSDNSSNSNQRARIDCVAEGVLSILAIDRQGK